MHAIRRLSGIASSLAAILLISALLAGSLLGGGWFICVFLDAGPESRAKALETRLAAGGSAIAGLIVLVTVWLVVRRQDRQTLLRAAAGIAGICLAVGIGELACRLKTPKWPARALHGVAPEVWSAATADSRSLGYAAVGLNSWGQHDWERTVVPRRGTLRIAFIGDSFLEEGSSLPVSIATEQKLDRSDVEIVNLGVSATGPDEYFDRLRGVALPLRAAHCCLFIFAGNDFVSPARTLPNVLGIAAVEPRPSLLCEIGLAGWNHVLTNRYRPVVRAWFEGASLAAAERSRFTVLKQVDDKTIRQLLIHASQTSGAARDHLAAVFEGKGIESFFQILRSPDEDRFRSYYLSDALTAAAQPGWKWEPNSEEVAWDWTERAARLCRARKIGLTVIMVPEGFQVDDRMREQWLPLADLRACTAPCRETAEKFVLRSRRAGIDVVDLHEVLQGSRGTYLNLDGHWSRDGVEVVATEIAGHLSGLLPREIRRAHGAQ